MVYFINIFTENRYIILIIIVRYYKEMWDSEKKYCGDFNKISMPDSTNNRNVICTTLVC